MADQMLGTVIRHLVENELATVKEIEEVTGRGSSTVYRWVKGEGLPQFSDVRALVRRLPNPEARRVMIALLSSDLPVVVHWEDDLVVDDETGRTHDGQDVIAKSLLALNCLTDLLSEQHEAVQKQELTMNPEMRRDLQAAILS